MNGIEDMIYLIAHIVDDFGHGPNILGCKMNEYRHMTYNIHFCSWNNFTDGTPYKRVNCWLITLLQNYIASQISKVICINHSDQHVMMCLFHWCMYVFRISRMLQWIDNFLRWFSNWEKEVHNKADLTADTCKMERCLLNKPIRDGWGILYKFIWSQVDNSLQKFLIINEVCIPLLKSTF